ncbi:MAG: OmpA family protein [Candidatus Omnitrophota bacterium]
MASYRRNIIFLLVLFLLTGCSIVLQKGRRSDIEKIQTLEDRRHSDSERIKLLEDRLAELKNARNQLEDRLSKELASKKVSVKMEDKGLVITFIAEVLFDSGKAELREDSLPILDKVAGILKQEVPNNYINIEGHTDNEPIKYSLWTSNWELSSHRALSVLIYLETKGINPQMLSATGFGEYRPVGPNDTTENRQLNRRVEIVIIANTIKRIDASDTLGKKYNKENLK